MLAPSASCVTFFTLMSLLIRPSEKKQTPYEVGRYDFPTLLASFISLGKINLFYVIPVWQEILIIEKCMLSLAVALIKR